MLKSCQASNKNQERGMFKVKKEHRCRRRKRVVQCVAEGQRQQQLHGNSIHGQPSRSAKEEGYVDGLRARENIVCMVVNQNDGLNKPLMRNRP
jgi:hypothetical protein